MAPKIFILKIRLVFRTDNIGIGKSKIEKSNGILKFKVSYKTIHHNLNPNKKMANILKKIQNIPDDKTFLFYHLILLAKI